MNIMKRKLADEPIFDTSEFYALNGNEIQLLRATFNHEL